MPKELLKVKVELTVEANESIEKAINYIISDVVDEPQEDAKNEEE